MAKELLKAILRMIIWLKNNYGYKDKTELEHSWEIKSIHDFTYDSMNDW